MAHFVNVNEEEEVFLLPYSIMISRSEEAERKLLFVLKQCEKHGIPMERVRTVEQLQEIVKLEAEERKTVSTERNDELIGVNLCMMFIFISVL